MKARAVLLQPFRVQSTLWLCECVHCAVRASSRSAAPSARRRHSHALSHLVQLAFQRRRIKTHFIRMYINAHAESRCAVCGRIHSKIERERLVYSRSRSAPRVCLFWHGILWNGKPTLCFHALICRVEENEENWSIFHFTMCTRKSENNQNAVFLILCVRNRPESIFYWKEARSFLDKCFPSWAERSSQRHQRVVSDE